MTPVTTLDGYNPLVRSFVQIGLPTSSKKGAPRNVVGVQPERWNVTLSAYGSASTFTLTIALHGGTAHTSHGPGAVSANQLTDNLYNASGQGLVTVAIYVGRPSDPVSWSMNDLTQVFTGYVDLVDWEYDTDSVTISGRDGSSLLMDSRTLDNFANHTPSAIATQFANEVGLTPVVSPTTENAGHYYQIDTVQMGSIPRQKWDLLLYLARQVGYDVYVTPQNQLVFGPPPATSATPLVFSWLDPKAQPGVAMKTCKITHSPRRNKTFQVLVKSYHPKEKVPTLGHAVVLGVDFPVAGSKTLQAGTYRGQGNPGSTIFNELGAALEGKPVYEFHIAGLNKGQVQARAEAIAHNIAKFELVAVFTVDGNAAITPQSSIRLQGLGYGFDTRLFYPTKVTHDFVIAEKSSTGWETTVSALNIPPSAVDDPSTALVNS